MSIVVAGYANTPHGQAALQRARTEAQLRGVPLRVVAYVGHDVGESPTQVRAQRESIDRLEGELEALATQLGSDEVVVSTEVRHGLPNGVSQALVEAADRAEADLLVIGMRRRSPVGKLVLGSVVQDVLLAANCPVLAVKAQEGARARRA